MDTFAKARTGQELRFLVSTDSALSGEENMARDVELFSRAACDSLALARIYTWNEPTVSLGRSQTRAAALLPNCVLPSVMRPTGGGAVLHGHDLTIGMAAHLSLVCGDSRNMRAIYRALITPLVRALNDIGVSATLAADSPSAIHSRQGADCFLSVSPNDVIHSDTRAKLIGCALRVSRDAALAQCSIPITNPAVSPSSVFASAHEFHGFEIDKSKLTSALLLRLS